MTQTHYAMSLNKITNKHLFTAQEESVPTRNGYGEGLVLAGQANPNVVVLCCDLTESTRSLEFKKQFPERFIEVGVAEQNMAGVAAGMAHYGKIPFTSSYATFSPGRNWDQVRVAIAYGNANVKIAGAHAGISVGPDGATHQALEDIAITRVLPNMIVISPCDAIEARKATLAAAHVKGPVYLRFAREKTPVMTREDAPFEIGQAYVMREGSDVSVIGTGPILYEALLAAECLAGNKPALEKLLRRYPSLTKRIGVSKLSGHSMTRAKKVTIWTPSAIKKMLVKKIEAEVINVPTIKPLDAKTLVASVKKTGCAITVEEHQTQGGLYGAVVEILAQLYPVPCAPIGMPDSFGESGEPLELLEKYGLTAPYIIQKMIEVIAMKGKRKNNC